MQQSRSGPSFAPYTMKQTLEHLVFQPQSDPTTGRAVHFWTKPTAVASSTVHVDLQKQCVVGWLFPPLFVYFLEFCWNWHICQCVMWMLCRAVLLHFGLFHQLIQTRLKGFEEELKRLKNSAICHVFACCFYQMTQITDVKAPLEKELLDVYLKKDCSCLCPNNDVSPVLRQVLLNILQKRNLVK